VVTSMDMDEDSVLVGMTNSRIHIFSAMTGVLTRTLVGHDSGVWAVCLISKEAAHASGLSDSLAITGGCDKILRVWNVNSGCANFGCGTTMIANSSFRACVRLLSGHTSTIRCIKAVQGRPLVVSGSRDCTLRVWDLTRGGSAIRVLAGHTLSVRCLDIHGNVIVSGSYDTTLRVWDIETGKCLHVLVGHYHQIYSVAFDGEKIASGGLDSTVRVWDAVSGYGFYILFLIYTRFKPPPSGVV
jgi:F-box and WD-40 domain protein CDC4